MSLKIDNFHEICNHTAKQLKYVPNTSFENSLNHLNILKTFPYMRTSLKCPQKWCVQTGLYTNPTLGAKNSNQCKFLKNLFTKVYSLWMGLKVIEKKNFGISSHVKDIQDFRRCITYGAPCTVKASH